jgi:cellobiose phosphorylase
MAFAQMGETERAWDLLAMLNPIHHSASPGQVATYRVEPYVLAADVYALAPHTGRGGWTWYTGSAGWMYRLLLETMLGLRVEGNQLRLMPRLPKTWPSFAIHYRYRQTNYHITVSRLPDGASRLTRIRLDGQDLAGETVPLQDDRRDHLLLFQIV